MNYFVAANIIHWPGDIYLHKVEQLIFIIKQSFTGVCLTKHTKEFLLKMKQPSQHKSHAGMIFKFLKKICHKDGYFTL